MKVCKADACRQGRDICPCPYSCEVPEPEDISFINDLVKAFPGSVAIVISVIGVSAFPAHFFAGYWSQVLYWVGGL